MILILGAGFLGKAIYTKLKSEGHTVSAFSRNADEEISLLHKGDLDNILDHAEIFNGVETIIYTIHTTVPSSAHKNEYYDVESNVLPFLNFLNAVRDKKVGRMIYISTGGAIYGNTNETKPLTESSAANPISAYGISKLAIEKQLLLNKQIFEKGTIILRPSNIYGKGQGTKKAQGVVSHLLHCAYSGKEFELWGDGESKKDYLHVNDFTNGIKTIIDHKGPIRENIFNIASKHTYTVNEIKAEIEKQTGKKINVKKIDAKEFDVRSFSIDPALFSKTFNWRSNYDLHAGISEIVNA